MAEQLTFTALERRKIKAELPPRTLMYVEALENVAREADKLMQANDEASKSRVQLAKVLNVVNFMA